LTDMTRRIFFLDRDLDGLGKALRALFVHNGPSNRLAEGSE
jgi:hypothetical protein